MTVKLTVASPPVGGPEAPETPSVLSYFAQRRAAGYIGFLLPIAAVLYIKVWSGGCLPGSISATYYTGVRNWFVGSLCSVGVFLICSIGYKEDKPWSIFAGIMAFVVAFCPTSPDMCHASADIATHPILPVVHTTAACLLFLTFAYFCLVLFVRTQKDGVIIHRPRLAELPKPKKQRNIVFIVCGSIMVSMMIVYALWIGASKLLHFDPPFHLLFVVEWICLWSFAIAWLVKGQQLLRDA